MPNASINGTELYYEVHGEGPAIVFAHGVGGNHAIWWQQTTYFKQWFQVVAFDHRGFGRSKELPEGPDVREYVQDLLELLDHLKIDKAALIAQSMGGWACLGMTARHPERVSALVMSDTTGGLQDAQIDSMAAEFAKVGETLSQSDRAISAEFQERDPGLTWLFLQINSFNKANRQVLRGRKEYKGPTPEEMIKSKVPILWITGTNDRVVSPDGVRRAHKIVPGSTLAEFPGPGHSVYWEQPEAYNYVVRGFLEKAGVKAAG